MIVDSLFSSINRGKKGLNKGLSSGFDKLDTITYGVQRKWMTIYCGDSGSVQHSIK
jgi:replicative DNA helicase